VNAVAAKKNPPVLELIADALHRAKPSGAIAFVFGDRQRLAPYCWSWPDEVARPFLFLAVSRSRLLHIRRTPTQEGFAAASRAAARSLQPVPVGRTDFSLAVSADLRTSAREAAE